MTHSPITKDRILFSIIVPCYNAEKYIQQLINSVITQSIPNWELILIDDGSTDNTAAICKQQQIVIQEFAIFIKKMQE